METFGNKLNNLIRNAKQALFLQGEMAQLTYLSFEKNVEWIISSKKFNKFSIVKL